MIVSIINFFSGDRKLSVDCSVELSIAIDYLSRVYSDVKIHSVHPQKGPIVIFKDTPDACDVAIWCTSHSK